MKKTLTGLLLLFIINIGYAQPKYDYSKLKREKLNRGIVAIKKDNESNFITWRYFSSDPINIAFNVYRDDAKINKKPIINSTCFIDKTSSDK